MKKNSVIFLFAVIAVLAIWTRLSQLDSLPIAPYWEEAALGYDAYSLLKTGKDHHGNPWPILAIESFGDWKPSGYFYAAIPSIALFDLTVFAVRLPSAIAGLAIIAGVGVLAYQLKGNALLAVFLTTISPWAILFSRAAWEVNVSTALILWGVIFSLKSMKSSRRRQIYLFSSVILFIFSIYTYHATRVIAPLLLGSLILYQLFDAKNKQSATFRILPSAILFMALFLPLLIAVKNPQVSQRFQETSIFSDLDIIVESNERRERADYSLVSTVLYNRYALFGREILNNALDHLNPQFLFISGDENPRHSTGLFGLLYHFEIVFLIIGFIYILIQGSTKQRFLLIWILITLIPVSLSKATPHALRFLPALPAVILLSHFGIIKLLSWIEHTFSQLEKLPVKNLALLCLVGLYTASFSVFWRHYSTTYRIKTASEWQYGYEELMTVVHDYRKSDQTAQIAISRKYGRPAMYYWFFTKANPTDVQNAETSAPMDQGEFLAYQNLYFFTEIKDLENVQPSLIAVTPAERPMIENEYREIHQIVSPTGEIIWNIFEHKDLSL